MLSKLNKTFSLKQISLVNNRRFFGCYSYAFSSKQSKDELVKTSKVYKNYFGVEYKSERYNPVTIGKSDKDIEHQLCEMRSALANDLLCSGRNRLENIKTYEVKIELEKHEEHRLEDLFSLLEYNENKIDWIDKVISKLNQDKININSQTNNINKSIEKYDSNFWITGSYMPYICNINNDESSFSEFRQPDEGAP